MQKLYEDPQEHPWVIKLEQEYLPMKIYQHRLIRITVGDGVDNANL